jgi:uncharacterized membrane protein YcaP (DUF421 family)
VLASLTSLGEVSYWEKGVRTAAVYFALLILLRLAGKRQLAQLNSFDLIVLLLVSNVVQNAVIGPEDSLTGGLLGAAFLLLLNYTVVRLTFLHPTLNRILEGRESILVAGGRLRRKTMKRELITTSELDAALRRQGIGGVEDVETVKLEPDGTLSAEQKPHPSTDELLAALERIEKKLG